jgi:putative restriction endonuclease
MNEIEFQIIEAYLIDGWSHRKIQSEILKMEAPVRGGGFETMKILHKFGITGKFKSILKGQKLNRELFQKVKNIEKYLSRTNKGF